jgi:hypothetical protein
MLRIVDSSVIVLLAPSSESFVVSWYTDKVHARLRKMSQGEDAGKPCLAGIGPAQDCKKAIDAYRVEHPNAAWQELYLQVPNHYVNAKSMYGAMRMLQERKHWQTQNSKGRP